jgi:hypothetical protein
VARLNFKVVSLIRQQQTLCGTLHSHTANRNRSLEIVEIRPQVAVHEPTRNPEGNCAASKCQKKEGARSALFAALNLRSVLLSVVSV